MPSWKANAVFIGISILVPQTCHFSSAPQVTFLSCPGILNIHTSPLHGLKLKLMHHPYLKTSLWNSLTIILCSNCLPSNLTQHTEIHVCRKCGSDDIKRNSSILAMHHKCPTVSIPESYQAIQGYIDPPKSVLPCPIYIQLRT